MAGSLHFSEKGRFQTSSVSILQPLDCTPMPYPLISARSTSGGNSLMSRTVLRTEATITSDWLHTPSILSRDKRF